MEMNTIIKLNLNDTVKVKLNEKGKEIYLKYLNLPFTDPAKNEKLLNNCEFQLWELFAIFGDFVGNGNLFPFDDGDISFQIKTEEL